MSFVVVLFKVDNSVAVIKKEWLINQQECYFPNACDYTKMMKNINSAKEVEKWKKYEIKIKGIYGKYVLKKYFKI